jgi:hypothetical protein
VGAEDLEPLASLFTASLVGIIFTVVGMPVLDNHQAAREFAQGPVWLNDDFHGIFLGQLASDGRATRSV